MTHLGLNSVALPRGGDEIVRIGWKMYSFTSLSRFIYLRRELHAYDWGRVRTAHFQMDLRKTSLKPKTFHLNEAPASAGFGSQ